MKNNDLFRKTIPELQNLVKERKVSYEEILQENIKVISTQEEKVNAYITLTTKKAIEERKKLSPDGFNGHNYLYGIPLSVKDTFTTKGITTTAGSKMLEDFIPPYNATSYQRLIDEGAVMLGKTNMDEFAHGFTTEYSAFKITHNPWNLNNVPGGSSGGSAASIAAGEARLSLASENFGSIIQPSSICGIVGMKPTYGAASRYGIIAMASSLECPGIMGKCVEDVAIGIDAIIGLDPLDATTFSYSAKNFFPGLSTSLKGKKIAVIRPIMENLDKEMVKTIENALKTLVKAGAEVNDINWYDLGLDSKIYDVLYRSEVASNLARYDGIRYGYRSLAKEESLNDYYLSTRDKFGPHVKRQIITDPILLSSDGDDVYRTVLKLRRRNQQYIDLLFKKYSAIISAASTFTDLKIGEVAKPEWREKNRRLGKINGAMMCPSVLYGYPAISFPIGFSKSNMPIGVNVFGFRCQEQELLNLAYSFQEESDLKCLRPELLS
ncbi:Asp-tRNA(Asn)/Glu-tRNA(Gln) amidotransferase subunit GatA [Candidatus Gottesmanbacteria bacterium]|nr:Asp-tRNA(Asn)/Glu-tRNA(Gln) amidotransferase subunit GatA [Candidatus Gottesmanbacteria bacterium]